MRGLHLCRDQSSRLAHLHNHHMRAADPLHSVHSVKGSAQQLLRHDRLEQPAKRQELLPLAEDCFFSTQLQAVIPQRPQQPVMARQHCQMPYVQHGRCVCL